MDITTPNILKQLMALVWLGLDIIFVQVSLTLSHNVAQKIETSTPFFPCSETMHQAKSCPHVAWKSAISSRQKTTQVIATVLMAMTSSAAAISANTKPVATVANAQPTTMGNESGETADNKERLSNAAIIGIAIGALGITVLVATAISIIYSTSRNFDPKRCERCKRVCRRSASKSFSTTAEADYTHSWYDSLSSLGPSSMYSHQKIPLDSNAEAGSISVANTSTAAENISPWSSCTYVPQELLSTGNSSGSTHQQLATPSYSQRGQERLHISWRSHQRPEEPIYTRALNTEDFIYPLKQATVLPSGSELESSMPNVSRGEQAELPGQQPHFATGTAVKALLLNNPRLLTGPPGRCEGSAYAGQFADMDLSLTDEEDDEEFTESLEYDDRSQGTVS